MGVLRGQTGAWTRQTSFSQPALCGAQASREPSGCAISARTPPKSCGRSPLAASVLPSPLSLFGAVCEWAPVEAQVRVQEMRWGVVCHPQPGVPTGLERALRPSLSRPPIREGRRPRDPGAGALPRLEAPWQKDQQPQGWRPGTREPLEARSPQQPLIPRSRDSAVWGTPSAGWGSRFALLVRVGEQIQSAEPLPHTPAQPGPGGCFPAGPGGAAGAGLCCP